MRAAPLPTHERQSPTVISQVNGSTARPRFLPLIAALVVGVLFGVPHVIMWLNVGARGQSYVPLVVDGVQALTYDETTYYAPRVRDVLDGHPFSAAPADWEHKGQTPFLGLGVIGPLLAAGLAKLLGGSVGGAFILCDFLLPPVSFLLIWLLCRRLGASTWVGVAAGLLTVIAHDQIRLPFVFAGDPSWQSLAEHLHIYRSFRPVEYSRLIVPQFSYILLLLAVTGLYETGRNPRLSTVVPAGLAMGCLFYSYVYFWTYVLAGASLWIIVLALQRRWAAARGILGAVGLACLLGLPVLLGLLGPASFAGKEYLMARQSWGGRYVRLLTHHKYEWALLATYFILYPWRHRQFGFVSCFVLAAYVCLAAARLVQLNVQEWHWFGRAWYPWMSVALVLGVWARVESDYRSRLGRRLAGWGRRALVPAMIVLSVFCLAYGFNSHIRYGLSMHQQHTVPSGALGALRWLQENAATDSVVMAADMNVLALVPVYTQCNSYLPYCLLSPASDDELVERFAITAAISGLSDDYISRLLAPDGPVAGFFQDHRWWGVNWLYHTRFGEIVLPPHVLNQVKRARTQTQATALLQLLSKYRLDYVWADEVVIADSSRNFGEAPFLRTVFSADGTRLYAVTQPAPAGDASVD